MSDVALPKIKVTDSQNLDGSTLGASGGVESPSTTDGGQPARPRSTTSSEGNAAQPNSKKAPTKSIRINSPKDTNGQKSTSPPMRPSTAIDPLSHHILKRTNTESTIPQKLRNAGSPEIPTPDLGAQASPEIGTPGRQNTPEVARSDSNPVKEKKKGVSFLSRFSIIGGKKKDFDVDDDESEPGDPRTEGMNAHVFSSSIGANGYIPQHKEPPRYIKVRAHNKKTKEFNRMFLAQELSGTKHEISNEKVPGLATAEVLEHHPHKLHKSPKESGAVWATEFSKDGKYLAAAGRDQVVRVWAVISTPEERQAHEHEEDVSSAEGGERLSAPVFRSKPIREFEGHTGDVLDLSWSKNNFLLSSSMDKTVRLWHISRQECLCTFKHKDFVTSIAFHPRDDRFFLAGSLDSVLRLWSIPDKSVAFWNQLPDLITAVAFSPDGKTAIAGVLSGLCLFYDTEGLKYHTQIHVRSSRGKNAKGSKITGIRTTTMPPDNPDGEIKVLISSNDSRVRMYNLRDKSVEIKFRGHENTCSQINASFSDDAEYIICGSEDRKAYIWSTKTPEAENKDKQPLEFFEAHSEMVTTAIMAPMKSRQLLSLAGDPIYDLCNPPPVTLLSREESSASSMPQSTSEANKRHSDPVSEPKKPEESPAYLARCLHLDGNIIITADYSGNIKVFRQDCAYQKRRNENWETGSTFSKKMFGRSNSIVTRGSRSRRNSTSRNSVSSFAGKPSDHILSWRDSVNSNVSLDSSLRKDSRNDRSVSPGKFTRSPYINSRESFANTARHQPYSPTPLTVATTNADISASTSVYKTPSNGVSQPPTPSFSINSASDDPTKDNPLRLDANGKSYQFWNMSTWRNQMSNAHDPNKLAVEGLKPPMERGGSFVSRLSSDEGSGELDDDDESESDSSALACRKCGGKDFRARKVAGKGQRLVCTKCGTSTD